LITSKQATDKSVRTAKHLTADIATVTHNAVINNNHKIIIINLLGINLEGYSGLKIYANTVNPEYGSG